MKPGSTPTYDEYYENMLGYIKKLEAAVADNTPSGENNVSKSDYLTPYSPSDSCYNNATDLSIYMIDREEDVDMVQDILQCNQAIKQGKLCPPPRTRRDLLCQELRIKDPIWSGLEDDIKRAWAKKCNNNKEKIIAQFVVDSKSNVPITKNRNLRTVYRMELEDDDGYESDSTANSEGIFQFNANSAIFDTTVDDNSNGEIILEGSNLNVNMAAATKKQRLSILKRNGRKTFKCSEMPAEGIEKMMSNKQL